jgi:putative DNA primase/helicase
MVAQSNERRQPINEMLEEALGYARDGYPVFPCDPRSKKPLTRHGFKDATTDEQQIRVWWRQWPNAMIGTPTGPRPTASGIDVLDLDFKPEEYIDGRETLPNWSELSPLHTTTPGGGLHLWFRSAGQLRNSTDIIGPGVDTRGVGGYVIVPPSRTPDGQYAFVGNVASIEELPIFPPQLLALLGPQSEARSSAKRRASPARVRAAMRVIPNEDVGWDDWKKWGLAIYAATNGSAEGLAIWQEWSAKSHKHDAANTAAEWDNIQRSPPTRIGAGSIFHAARQVNPRWQAVEEIASEDTVESEASSTEGADNTSAAVICDAKAPLQSARVFVRQQYQQGEAPGIIYYHNTFYGWTGTHYQEIDDAHLRSKVYEFLDHAITPKGLPFNPNPHSVSAVIDALKAGVEQQSSQNPPFWLDDEPSVEANELIACRNGLLKIRTRELLAHTPLLFNLNCLPYDFDANAPAYPPLWMNFLRQILPDKQARLTLQEIFGLALTTDTRYQKIFMMIGPGRSGKGTVARVLTGMVGKSNVVSPTMASMTGEFGLWPLIDKQVAIISDARLGKRADSSVVAERLLSISGEDGQTINRKNKSFWSGRLFVRFLILSNELPRIPDASGTLASRFVVLMLTKSFLGREDPELTEKLLTELPGILNWALIGLERLRRRGRFVMPEASLDAIRQLEDLASPVGAFFRDWCETAPEARIRTKTLFAAWKRYCEQHGLPPGSSIVFGRNLRAVRPEIGTAGRGRNRYYSGVRFSAEGLQEYEEATREACRQARGNDEAE